MDDLPPLRRTGPRRGAEPLDQRLDRWMRSGRQLVDGVAGARPGSRPGVRGTGRRDGSRPSLDGLGRWVEDRLDWLLEDDDWREPWQEDVRPQEPPPRRRLEGRTDPSRTDPSRTPAGRAWAERGLEREAEREVERGAGGRRSLEAISRRGLERLLPARGDQSQDSSADWPDDTSFQLSRWQRPLRSAPDPLAQPRPLESPSGRTAAPLERPLPRSTRRRP